MKKITVVTLLLTLSLFSCKKDNDCNYDSCANKAPDSEIQSLQAYITNNSIVATQHCSGVFYRIETEGSGNNPNPCSNILFRYKGSLTNGTVFDESTAPVSYGLDMLVPAWRNVLPLLKKGGKMVMLVPPSLGYGSQPYQTIPANSVLIFEVELVDVL